MGDKGYAGRAFRAYLRGRRIGVTIARRANERRAGVFDKEAYRKRNIVERLINRLKRFRRLATRYEKQAVNFAAMITVAAVYIFSNFAYRL